MRPAKFHSIWAWRRLWVRQPTVSRVSPAMLVSSASASVLVAPCPPGLRMGGSGCLVVAVPLVLLLQPIHQLQTATRVRALAV